MNILSKTSLDYVLDNNKTVLAIWNSENCMDCTEEMWNVYKAIYSFLDEPNVGIHSQFHLVLCVCDDCGSRQGVGRQV